MKMQESIFQVQLPNTICKNIEKAPRLVMKCLKAKRVSTSRMITMTTRSAIMTKLERMEYKKNFSPLVHFNLSSRQNILNHSLKGLILKVRRVLGTMKL